MSGQIHLSPFDRLVEVIEPWLRVETCGLGSAYTSSKASDYPEQKEQQSSLHRASRMGCLSE